MQNFVSLASNLASVWSWARIRRFVWKQLLDYKLCHPANFPIQIFLVFLNFKLMPKLTCWYEWPEIVHVYIVFHALPDHHTEKLIRDDFLVPCHFGSCDQLLQEAYSINATWMMAADDSPETCPYSVRVMKLNDCFQHLWIDVNTVHNGQLSKHQWESWLVHTTWFCAQIETTPLDMEAMIGRIGCHWGTKQHNTCTGILSWWTHTTSQLRCRACGGDDDDDGWY